VARPGCTLALTATILMTACGSPTHSRDSDPPVQGDYALEVVAQGLDDPLLVVAAPEDPRLFVLEQGGRVRIIAGGSLVGEPYLDLTDRVGSGGERGLLGLALDPDFRSTGRIWVMYTDRSGTSTVEEFRDVPGADRADPTSGQVYLRLPQPYANHNGGHLAFGPDGFLYIALGDGGGGGDPLGNGQNPSTLLGSILRVDPRGAPGPPWEIPPSNPFVGTPGARPEIFHYGLRNPWRFSFDAVEGLMWIADVGQNRWEEVDVVPTSASGVNFGWNLMEGSECFGGAACERAGLREPVYAYGRDLGCSITGGHVYRGRALPALVGWYVFSDYCAGWLHALRLTGQDEVEAIVDLGISDHGQVTSFGTDTEGELYVVVQGGTVYRLAAAG
jgi:glucose/arabinose dehydrogenase